MKRLGDLMKELGFRPQSSRGAQEAFLKNAIRQAYGDQVADAVAVSQEQTLAAVGSPEQLSFNISDLVPLEKPDLGLAPSRKRRARYGR